MLLNKAGESYSCARIPKETYNKFCLFWDNLYSMAVNGKNVRRKLQAINMQFVDIILMGFWSICASGIWKIDSAYDITFDSHQGISFDIEVPLIIYEQHIC